MDRLDEMISNGIYIIDALIALRRITKSGCCNTCGVIKECTYKPKPGEIVRYNCPFYEEEDQEE